MSGGSFLDTNVLVYADDIRFPEKRERAKSLIKQFSSAQTAFVSMQVLQEYFSIATSKLGLEAGFAQKRVEQYSDLNVVPLETPDLLKAIDLHIRYQFSIWDALIVRAALISDCETLYTEDLQHGQRIGNLTILNPF